MENISTAIARTAMGGHSASSDTKVHCDMTRLCFCNPLPGEKDLLTIREMFNQRTLDVHTVIYVTH